MQLEHASSDKICVIGASDCGPHLSSTTEILNCSKDVTRTLETLKLGLRRQIAQGRDARNEQNGYALIPDEGLEGDRRGFACDRR